MHHRLAHAGLLDIAAKLDRGERLDLSEGVRLFESPDLLAVGWLANREREKRHGARTFYNYNIRLEATNVCVASCLFCAFARLKPGDEGAYTMSLEQAWDKLRQRAHQPLTEIHVVNGLHPDLPFDYYTELLRGFKRIRPDIHLKCFTAVEIAFFADLYRITDEQVMRELMAAGLDSLPGGGSFRIWLLSGWNASGMNAWKPQVSSCSARARSMWSTRSSAVSICPYSIVTFDRMPSRWAVR